MLGLPLRPLSARLPGGSRVALLVKAVPPLSDLGVCLRTDTAGVSELRQASRGADLGVCLMRETAIMPGGVP